MIDGAGRLALVTGAAGFKGRWLMSLLDAIGFEVLGWDHREPDDPGEFQWVKIDLTEPFELPSNVDFVFHLAAQSLVPLGYEQPGLTWSANVTATVNLLEALRMSTRSITAIAVTSDKVYRLPASPRPLTEDDPIGGYCPYSSSKAACELAVESYRSVLPANIRVATVRSGNVIGPGDDSPGRLVPDIIRAAQSGQPVELRNPTATRPWLFVLDCLWGYMLMAVALDANAEPGHTMNFGPAIGDEISAAALATEMTARLGSEPPKIGPPTSFHEAPFLQLDSSRAAERLGWRPRLSTRAAVEWTADWAVEKIRQPGSGRALADQQITRYLEFVQN